MGEMGKLALCKPYAVPTTSLCHALFSHHWISCEQWKIQNKSKSE